MASIDLMKNRESILLAHKQISDVNNADDWALFGYEGRTNVLKVISKGDGGIEEMVDELRDGQIMYAYCRVVDPNTKLPKFVLINWQGEAVPDVRKGTCAMHTFDVGNILRGAHVIINATTEEEVEEDVIREKVAASSGCNYSIHGERRPQQPDVIAPVGSVYKRTVPSINTAARDQFWEKKQGDEKKAKEMERQKSLEHQKTIEEERKSREAMEAKQREERESERLRHIRDIRRAEQLADTSASSKDHEKQTWEASQREALRDEDERRKRSEMMRKARAAEAKSLVGQRETNPLNRFRQRSQFDDDDKNDAESSPAKQAPPPSRRLKDSFVPASTEPVLPPDSRKQPIESPRGETARAPSPPAPQRPTPEPVITKVTEPEAAIGEPATTPSAVISQPALRNLAAMGLSPQRASDDEEEEDDGNWDEPSTEDFVLPESKTPQALAEQQQQQQQQLQLQQQQQQQSYDDASPEELYGDAATGQPVATAATSGMGCCARALYDYQAAADDEITFDPGDIITDIDQVDDGWWIGTAPDGHQGMFPANFVELI